MMNEMNEHHAFSVKPEHLPTFISEIEHGDSMGGNGIVLLKDCGQTVTIVIKRRYSYPFVINQLRKLEKMFQ